MHSLWIHLGVMAGILLMLAGAGLRTAGARPQGESQAEEMASLSIALVGDSTVTEAKGWGAGFAARCKDHVACANFARGGRSSKSFHDEGLWQPVLEHRPDLILIQFGHNDQPGKGPHRETDPATTFRDHLRRYIRDSLAIDATPILVTSLERRRFAPDGTITPTLADYAEATRQVAAEAEVLCIDLHQRSIELYERLGPAGCEELSPRNADGSVDTTHLNERGGEVIGALVVAELIRVKPDLASHFVRPVGADESSSHDAEGAR